MPRPISELHLLFDQLEDAAKLSTLKTIALEVTEPIQDEAARRAPYDNRTVRDRLTGYYYARARRRGNEPHIRDSMTRAYNRQSTVKSVEVDIGPSKVVGWRARFLEFGTRFIKARPFMRPALDERGPEAGRAFSEKVAAEIIAKTRSNV